MEVAYVTAKRRGQERLSKRFIEMSEIYRVFARQWQDHLDFSEEALLEMYRYETRGGNHSAHNGFYWGKKWLNVHVAMWKEDIAQGLLFKQELYRDEQFPHWWLDSIFKGWHPGRLDKRRR